MTKDQTQLRSLLRLMAVPNVGEARLRFLVDTFKSPENVFAASAADIAALPNYSQTLAETILTHRNDKWIDRYWKKRANCEEEKNI